MTRRSKVTDLNDMIYLVAPKAKNRKHVDILYFNIRNGTVPNNILLRKLACYVITISILAWAQPYLARTPSHGKVAREI